MDYFPGDCGGSQSVIKSQNIASQSVLQKRQREEDCDYLNLDSSNESRDNNSLMPYLL